VRGADQFAACAMLDDGERCALGDRPGTCRSGACFPATCGDGIIEANADEMCDPLGAAPEARCSSDCRSDLTCGNAIHDLETGEQCDDDAITGLGRDGCSSTCSLERATWTNLGVAPELRDAPLSWDVGRRELVMFGGGSVFGRFDDTWSWNGVRWAPVPTTEVPFGRAFHAIAYDEVHRHHVMFGGSPTSGETWVLDHRGWTLRTPTRSPPARSAASMVYDPTRGRVLLVGGIDELSGTELTDTWTWTGDTWELLFADGPSPRANAAIAFDPERQVVVLVGGHGTGAPSDTYELTATGWVDRAPAVLPPPMETPAMTYVPALHALLLVDTVPSGETAWLWDGATWQPGPTPDSAVLDSLGALATDPDTGRVYLLAIDAAGFAPVLAELVGSTWRLLRTMIRPLSPRFLAAAAQDPVRREVIVAGGCVDQGDGFQYLDDTWRFRGSWEPVVTTGTFPERCDAQLAFDPSHGHAVMFGGTSNSGTLDDTWVFANDTWTQIPRPAPAIPWPELRAQYGLVWAGDRVLMLGGLTRRGGAPVVLDDVWAWTGTAWTPVATTNNPPPRVGAAYGYDPIRRRVVMFGGSTLAAISQSDTWLLDPATGAWSPGPTGPPARVGSSFVWDAARRSLVMAGGRFTSSGALAAEDLWELDLATGWSSINIGGRPPPRIDAAWVPGLQGGALYIGGTIPKDTNTFGDTWSLAWTNDEATEACFAVDTDGDGLASCDDPDCWWACDPACSPGVCPD